MTPIEIIAALAAVLFLMKFVLIMTARKKLIGLTKTVLGKNAAVFRIVYAAIILVVGYFIFTTINVLQIAAVLLFAVALTKMTFLYYPKASEKFAEEILKDKNMLKRCWFSLLIIVAIMLLVVYELLF